MELNLYKIEDYFQQKDTMNFSNYIQNKIEEMGTNLYIDMKEFHRKRDEDIPTDHYIYLLKIDNQVVGYRYFYINPETKVSELFAIAVDPDFRKRGFAKKMIDKAIDFLIGQNVKKIKVTVVKSSETGTFILENYYLNNIQPKYNDIIWDIHAV